MFTHFRSNARWGNDERLCEGRLKHNHEIIYFPSMLGEPTHILYAKHKEYLPRSEISLLLIFGIFSSFWEY